MRIDAHQHFWKYSPAEYGWINDEMAALKRDFLPGDLQPLLAANGFDGCHCRAGLPHGRGDAMAARTRREERLHQRCRRLGRPLLSRPAGTVGCPCASSEAGRRSSRGAGGARRRVHAAQRFSARHRCVSPDYGLTYDLLLYPRHLPVAVKLVQQFPRQRFVLDHIAKPGIARWPAGTMGTRHRRTGET